MEYLLLAIGLSIVGVTIVVLRNRRPRSMNSSIDEFRSGLDALAPEEATPLRRERGRDTGADRSG